MFGLVSSDVHWVEKSGKLTHRDIEIFDSTKDENGKKHVPIKVHFIGVGVIVIPDGKTILETYEEIRKNPPKVA